MELLTRIKYIFHPMHTLRFVSWNGIKRTKRKSSDDLHLRSDLVCGWHRLQQPLLDISCRSHRWSSGCFPCNSDGYDQDKAPGCFQFLNWIRELRFSGVAEARGNILCWRTWCNKEDFKVLAVNVSRRENTHLSAGKKAGERFGKVELPGRCARRPNSESPSLPTSLCSGCYS